MHICLKSKKKAKILDIHVHTKHFFIQAAFKEKKKIPVFVTCSLSHTHTQIKLNLLGKRRHGIGAYF